MQSWLKFDYMPIVVYNCCDLIRRKYSRLWILHHFYCDVRNPARAVNSIHSHNANSVPAALSKPVIVRKRREQKTGEGAWKRRRMAKGEKTRVRIGLEGGRRRFVRRILEIARERWRSRNFRILQAVPCLSRGGERERESRLPETSPFLTLNCLRAASQTSHLFHVYFTVFCLRFFFTFRFLTAFNFWVIRNLHRATNARNYSQQGGIRKRIFLFNHAILNQQTLIAVCNCYVGE